VKISVLLQFYLNCAGTIKDPTRLVLQSSVRHFNWAAVKIGRLRAKI